MEINPKKLDDRTPKPLRMLLDRWDATVDAATLELAGELWQTRQEFQSDLDFRLWIGENELDIAEFGKRLKAVIEMTRYLCAVSARVSELVAEKEAERGK